MKKLFILIILLIAIPSYSAPPQRQVTYVNGTTIKSNDVRSNEDEIFGYLQTGVDTIRTGGLDAITEINSALRSGADQTLITGTEGTSGQYGQWNSDGDLVGDTLTLSDLDDVNTSTPSLGRLLIADGTEFESIAMSGDCTINSSGAIACVTSGSSTLSSLTDVNTATPSAGNLLIADGTDFESMSMNGDCTINRLGTVACSAAATSLDSLSDVGTAAETIGFILIADGADYEGVAMSGDATINSSGSLQLGADSVGTNEASFVGAVTGTLGNILVADGTDFESVSMSSAATISSTGVLNLTDFGTTTGTLGNILVADGTDFESVVMGGDATISSAGSLQLGADSVGTAEVSFVGSVTGTAGRILVADGTDFESVAMGGEAVISSAGSVTLADSVTVTGWVMGASTATTPATDDNDTSLATTAYTQTEIGELGGRSLTVTSGVIDADTEIYTDTKCINIDPTATTTNWFMWRVPKNITITGVDCIVDVATSVVLTPNECDSNGGTCSVIESALTCGITNTPESGAVDNSSIDSGDYIRVTRGALTGSATQAVLCLEYTAND